MDIIKIIHLSAINENAGLVYFENLLLLADYFRSRVMYPNCANGRKEGIGRLMKTWIDGRVHGIYERHRSLTMNIHRI